MSRLPPHSLDAEASLLGAMLLSREAIYDAMRAGVTADDFYSPHNAVLFEAIEAMHLDHRVVDPVTVADWLTRAGRFEEMGGMGYLLGLQNTTPSLSGVGYYAKIVQDTSMLRRIIATAAAISELGYDAPDDVDRALAEASDQVRTLVTTSDRRLLRGYYDDIGLLNTEGERDSAQPWIARGVIRRQQRGLVVARAGIGKSVLLRQIAACCVNGVHPWTGQRTEVPRDALVVELEAGDWDISSSMTTIGFALQRILQTASVWDANRPALLHRPGGIDLRTPAGYATLEAAIRRAQPELVVMGPLKYLSVSKPGENYEIAALNLMSLLNELMERYRFALVMEAHFSRGDHGAPGGSERWVDWPDVGFGIHPPSDDLSTRLAVGGSGVDMAVKQFRIPRDSDIWVPSGMIRGAADALPWLVADHVDPYRYGAWIYASRYGGVPAVAHNPNVQGEF